MKSRYYLIPVAILLLCILIFGFTLKSNTGNKDIIPWSARSLTWDDFEMVNNMEEDYVATIYSQIACPNLITDNDSRVYAFMNPNLSERLKDEHDSYNVLVHEQYHFNLTEYCARLLRKDIVERGLGGLSFKTMKSLKEKYSKKLDSLQTVYDRITDHNANTHLQRYWELQIDDWLRQTASYQNEDIYSYHSFTKNRTAFFKIIYFTITQKVLMSYPVGEKDKAFGEVYEIVFPRYGEKEMLVKFYKNGKLTNGGYFETAVTKIYQSENGDFEVHYYNPEETYNSEMIACIRKIKVDENKNMIERFFNAREERVYRNSVYEIHWEFNPNEKSYYTTYYNKEGQKIANKYGIPHEKRTLDEKERTILVENLDRRNRAKNDDSYIARYETTYSEEHVGLFKRLYDEHGNFALHLSDYHLKYEYDQWGRKVRITSLDADGEKTYDHNGASIYEYTYDVHDRQTSVKRFNTKHQPIVANDDYFQKVIDYDAEGNILFEAKFYPEYVMRFSDKKDGALKYVYENETVRKIFNVDAYSNIFENDLKVAITVQNLNAQKQVIKETHFDSNENYAKTDDGVVTYHYKYDGSGNQIEAAAYDSIGRPREFETDVTTIRWKYDAKGNKLKTAYFNKNNELAFSTDSVTYNVYAYDEGNVLYKRTNFDKHMHPAEIDGTFKSLIHTNTSGLDSLILEYDSNNRLKKGVAITRYYYTPYGNVSRVEYLDRNNQRTKNQNGVSAINYVYNKRHLLTGLEYVDEKNRLTNNPEGVALEKWTLDNLGHTLTYAYFDKEKNPAIGEYGYHKVEYEWSNIGQSTRSTTYGTDLKPISDEFGTAIYQYTLTPSGMVQTIERYNPAGILANNTNNVAITQYEPGLNGLYFVEKELNASGEIVNDSIADQGSTK